MVILKDNRIKLNFKKNEKEKLFLKRKRKRKNLINFK